MRDRLLAIVFASLAIRLLLAPFGGYAGDLAEMGFWAGRLVTEPLSVFYATPQRVDHLPGDLWILAAVAKLYQAFSPAMQVEGAAFRFLLKLVPALADAGIAVLLFLLGRRLARPGVGLLAALFFMLNPGSIFLTSIWGQWDSVSAFFMLVALWLLWRGNPEWSFPVLTYAALIKPQMAALGPLFALAFCCHYLLPQTRWGGRVHAPQASEPLARSLRRGLVALVASVLVMLAVLLPFNVGVPPLPTRWSLFERLQYSYDVWPFATLNAFNFWALWALPSYESWQPDERLSLFGLSYKVWGTLLLAAAYGTILVLYGRSWRRASKQALLWACLVTAFALFMFPTRVHERYLFPTMAFAALAAAVMPRLRAVYFALSLIFAANLYWAYASRNPAPVHPALYSSNLFSVAASCLNFGLLLFVFFRALPLLRDADRGAAAKGLRLRVLPF